MGMIKGITVVLYEKTENGKDEFNHPKFSENAIEVNNVLVTPLTSNDLVSEIQLSGKRAEYELCIPKGDTHQWEDCKVEFFGITWRTFGFAQEWIENNVPLDWNRKIKVERYG